MKKLSLVILFYLFSQPSSFANERDNRLNQLFNELKANKSKVAFIVVKITIKTLKTEDSNSNI